MMKLSSWSEWEVIVSWTFRFLEFTELYELRLEATGTHSDLYPILGKGPVSHARGKATGELEGVS